MPIHDLLLVWHGAPSCRKNSLPWMVMNGKRWSFCMPIFTSLFIILFLGRKESPFLPTVAEKHPHTITDSECLTVFNSVFLLVSRDSWQAAHHHRARVYQPEGRLVAVHYTRPVSLSPWPVFLCKGQAFFLHFFSQKRLFGNSNGQNFVHPLEPVPHKSGRLILKTFYLLKGTVARDFRPPLFSIKRTYLGPWYIS